MIGPVVAWKDFEMDFASDMRLCYPELTNYELVMDNNYLNDAIRCVLIHPVTCRTIVDISITSTAMVTKGASFRLIVELWDLVEEYLITHQDPCDDWGHSIGNSNGAA